MAQLFDKGRREKVRDALDKGKLGEILRRNGARPLEDGDTMTITVEDSDIIFLDSQPTGKPGLSPTLPSQPSTVPAALDRGAHCESGVVALDAQHRPKAIDQALFDAIQAGDLAAVRAAIRQGADIHSKQMHVPRHRMGDCIVSGLMTPLEYAIKKGRETIAWELRQQGAKA